MQRALWDTVSAGLRAVAVRISDHSIDARFLFDHEPDDDDREDVSLAETSVIADFPAEVKITFRVDSSPGPRTLSAGEQWVFLRKE